ncbi:hypothetical protein Terro_4077 [Terriglobus roseus DSM 18391]|uniref:Uncharacterized protein n=1 Tax=Terriglobus roseus (strain DSM 18391 / NRRL B-41598 / KBS 63) TaxID=926566 RepID=I3ZM16_TERRK|nr:hypothetical protein [Terriglobus roseus]AFL90284.1 hypothetical protein Terro_4077 [Terriglobus roseus DSM 18391]
MNDIDKNLERVLRGLREVAPDASLEVRIAQALREAQPEATSVRWFGDWSHALRLAGAVAVCAVLVAIVMRPSHERRTSKVAHHAPLVEPMIATQPPARVAVVIKRREGAPSRRLVPDVTIPHDTANATAQPQSFPAPPLPLTEQERLLIRLAHRDDPVQLARLGPGPRDDRYQAEKDQVSEFFKPAPPIAQPDRTDTTLMESGGGTQ